MSEDSNEQLGHLDDDAEAREPSSTTAGAAAQGEYDPAQGSPGTGHPTRHGASEETGETSRAEGQGE